MNVLILQPLPGTIGGLPPGATFVPGAVHAVPDDIGQLFLREGWARRAPERTATPDAAGADAAGPPEDGPPAGPTTEPAIMDETPDAPAAPPPGI